MTKSMHEEHNHTISTNCTTNLNNVVVSWGSMPHTALYGTKTKTTIYYSKLITMRNRPYICIC